jgi:hypothetical protein
MANHTGVDGVVKVGTNTVAEVRNWSISETADTIEDTTMNDTSRTYPAGLKSWSGNLTAFWDETDTNGQVALTIGSSAVLNLYPEGATTGDIYYSGTAIINSVGISVPTGGMIERSLGFQGSGALTIGTAA